MTAKERESYFKLTGEIWGVYHENFEENWQRNNGTALHLLFCSGTAFWNNEVLLP